MTPRWRLLRHPVALPPSFVQLDGDSALHEIGHAIVALCLGHTVESISIVLKGMLGGITATVSHTLVPTWNGIMDSVSVQLGGRASEIEIGRGANARAEADLAAAAQLLANALARYGLGDKLLHLPDTSWASTTLGDEIDVHLKRQLQRAQDIIRINAGVARRLAERLMRKKVLSGAVVLRALEHGTSAKRSDAARNPPRSKDDVPGWF